MGSYEGEDETRNGYDRDAKERRRRRRRQEKKKNDRGEEESDEKTDSSRGETRRLPTAVAGARSVRIAYRRSGRRGEGG